MEDPINVDETISLTKEPIKNENKARSNSGSDGSGSPPPNCSICLGKLVNTSFTDSCLHQFCFTCLLQWSKIKTECPLCKQTFKSIIHNVRGERDYDQYHVPRDAPPLQPPTLLYRPLEIQSPSPSATLDVNFEFVRGPSDLGFRRLSYRTTMTGNRRYRMLLNSSVSRPEAVADLVQQVSSEERRRRSEHPTIYRRNVYRYAQWSSPLQSAIERPLEHSAEYFRRNPCELERLIPWINRDLQILLNANEPHIAYVLRAVLDALKDHDLRSAELRDRLRPYFAIHTDHFIHELMNFARTGVDLAAYDNFITYPHSFVMSNNYANTVQQSPVLSSDTSTTSDDSDVRVVDEIDSTRINFNDYPSVGVHTINMPGPSNVSQTFQMPIVDSVMTLRQPNSPDLLIISSSSSSDENECEFVGYVKPRHERTPEIIEIVSSDGGGDDGNGDGNGNGNGDGDNNYNNGGNDNENKNINNVVINNTHAINDDVPDTPTSPSLNFLEPRPSTSHDFDDNRRTTRRKTTSYQNLLFVLSSSESQSESESDSDSNYSEPKKKTCRKSKKKLSKSNKYPTFKINYTSKKSTSKNIKKRDRFSSSDNDNSVDDDKRKSLRKKAKIRYKKNIKSSTSDDSDDKNNKNYSTSVNKNNNNSFNNNKNNNLDHTEDSDSSTCTNLSKNSSRKNSCHSRSSSQNSFHEKNKKRKKKTTKTSKRTRYESKSKKNKDTSTNKNIKCLPVSTVLKKNSNIKDEWYVDKNKFNSNIYDSSNDSDDASYNKNNFKKELMDRWSSFDDCAASNDEYGLLNKKSDDVDKTNRTNSQNGICSEINNSSEYLYREKYKNELHHIDKPSTSSQSLTSSLSSFKYSDDKKPFKIRHKSHKKYKSSRQKRSKAKKSNKKNRTSSSSSSSTSSSSSSSSFCSSSSFTN